KNAGDVDPFLVGRKSVEIFACQPGAKGVVVLLVKFVGGVSRSLKRRTTARRADENGMRTITDCWSQRPMLDIVEGNFATTDFVALPRKRILQRPNTFRRIICQDPAKHEAIVSVYQCSRLFIALRGAVDLTGELFEILIQRRAI